MKNKITILILALFLANSFQLKAQYAKEDTTYKKCFVGSITVNLKTFIICNNLIINPQTNEFY